MGHISCYSHHFVIMRLRFLHVASVQAKNVTGWDVGKGHKSLCAKCHAHMTKEKGAVARLR